MFVAKIAICFGIISICTLLGMKKSKKYEIRERMIKEAKTMFSGIKSEIKYMLTCLPDALEKLRQNMDTNLKHVMGAISVDMLSGNYDDEEKINRSIYENVHIVNELTNYDKEIICKGLINLGRGDIETQMGILQGVEALLDSQLSEALEEKNKNVKMYRSLGAAIGLMIAIVFI